MWDFFQGLFQSLLADPEMIEIIGSICAIIITAIVGRVGGAFVGAKRMEALHSAVRSAVVATLKENPQAGMDVLREAVVAHLRQSVPTTLRKLMPKLSTRLKLGGTTSNPNEDPILERLIGRYVGEFGTGADKK